MLRKYTLLLTSLVYITIANAQEFKQVAWDKIDFEVNSPTSEYFYKNLYNRYVAADTTLTENDYFYLYYGYPTQENYKPLLESKFRDQLKEIFAKREAIVDFRKIVSLTNSILETEPFNLRDINALAFALNMLGQTEEAAAQMKKVEMIAKTIKSTGSGYDQKSPWYVIYTENCEDLLGFMGLNSTRKMIVSKDILFIQVSNMPENLKKLKGYYFNYAEIYKRKPSYLDGIEKPKRKMEFNPKYNPKSDANVLKTNKSK